MNQAPGAKKSELRVEGPDGFCSAKPKNQIKNNELYASPQHFVSFYDKKSVSTPQKRTTKRTTDVVDITSFFYRHIKIVRTVGSQYRLDCLPYVLPFQKLRRSNEVAAKLSLRVFDPFFAPKSLSHNAFWLVTELCHELSK